jgi:hypothetical protein
MDCDKPSTIIVRGSVRDMKIQDLIFVIVFGIVVLSRRSKVLVYVGLVSLIISMGLYAKWVFFTAERLTWYASVFFLTYIVMRLVQNNQADKFRKDNV